MDKYRNLNGDLGVHSYEIDDTSITIQFRDTAIYTYTYISAGPSHVERMKMLAQVGKGLNSYINKYVRNKYASRRR